ncbi:MAG: hypothetical protein ACI906_002839 [Candidatus Latescibacterota bacterium]|jgi:hypothetical protein
MRLLIPIFAAAALVGCSDSSTPTGPAEPAAKGTRSNITVSSTVAGGLRDRNVQPTSFKVRIENIAASHANSASGAFNTPVGASAPGALLPGNSYSFSFAAGPGSMLSFATMFVQSNDLFYGAQGISLFEGTTAIAGDITAQVGLWDAGSEVNQEPGVGADQAPRQSGANTGAAESGNVRLVNDGFTYPNVSDNIRVSLSHSGETFTVTVENLAASNTPLAPGVYAVHTSGNPLYDSGSPDRGLGLAALAEDGNPADLAAALAAATGLSSPLAPGVFIAHRNSAPLFSNGSTDRGLGLAALAEDGNPADLAAALTNANSGVFNTPVGASGPGALLPGSAYEFSVTAKAGDRLSFATMFVQSNDLFYAPSAAGIALFDGSGIPLSGDITSHISLWDAGSEVNQAPGAGADQAPRQASANTGTTEGGNVRLVDDDFSYPSVGSIIRVTIAVQ